MRKLLFSTQRCSCFMKKKCWLWHKNGAWCQGAWAKKAGEIKKNIIVSHYAGCWARLLSSVEMAANSMMSMQKLRCCYRSANDDSFNMRPSVWGDKYLHTAYLRQTCVLSTLETQPLTFIGQAGCVTDRENNSGVAKYNKRHSQIWFMFSAQGGRREIRQEEIVTREWPRESRTH